MLYLPFFILLAHADFSMCMGTDFRVPSHDTHRLASMPLQNPVPLVVDKTCDLSQIDRICHVSSMII